MTVGGGGGGVMIGGGGGGPGRHAQSRRWLPSLGDRSHGAVAVEYEQMALSRHMYGMPQLSAFEASCSDIWLHVCPAATNAASTAEASVSALCAEASHVWPMLPQMASHDP